MTDTSRALRLLGASAAMLALTSAALLPALDDLRTASLGVTAVLYAPHVWRWRPLLRLRNLR